MSGRVMHFELPFDDGERCRDFYSQAFGWQMMPMPEMDYTIVMTGPSGDAGPTEPGYINGGLMQRQGDLSSPNIVIEVADIATALAAVGKAGGTTAIDRFPVGDMGFVAYIRDTEGNLIGLWENA